VKEGLIEQVKTVRQFFLNTISCLSEEDSPFAPKPEMYTVAQLVGHTAHTVQWFIDGAFGPSGFDMDFDNYFERMKKYQSLKQGIEEFEKAIEYAIKTIREADEVELIARIPEGQIMAGGPKMAVIGALADHTAHHRGALGVYARLLGKVPQMPYGEM
jgi:uncharacterized damage-inducible protein DinB